METSGIEVALDPRLEQEIRRRLTADHPDGLSKLIEQLLVDWLNEVQPDPVPPSRRD